MRNATAGVGSTPTRSTSAPAADQAGGDRRLEHLAAGPRIAAHDGQRSRGRATARVLDEHAGGAGATASASSGDRSAFASPRTPSVPKAAHQRFEYWGAFRAFFRPYFLRSVARGSRVRKPAFLRPGRSSGSTSMRARARRDAGRRPGPTSRHRELREDVELLGALGHHQGLTDELLVHLVREVLLERLPVHRELAVAGDEANADDGLLAAADRLDGAVDRREHRRGGIAEDLGLRARRRSSDLDPRRDAVLGEVRGLVERQSAVRGLGGRSRVCAVVR